MTRAELKHLMEFLSNDELRATITLAAEILQARARLKAARARRLDEDDGPPMTAIDLRGEHPTVHWQADGAHARAWRR